MKPDEAFFFFPEEQTALLFCPTIGSYAASPARFTSMDPNPLMIRVSLPSVYSPCLVF